MEIRPKALWIRYTLKHPRIISLIPQHFNDLERIVKENGGTQYNIAPVLQSMGIPSRRWRAIRNGAMPTLGETVGYAEHFKIEIENLYEVIPTETVSPKKRTKKAA